MSRVCAGVLRTTYMYGSRDGIEEGGDDWKVCELEWGNWLSIWEVLFKYRSLLIGKKLFHLSHVCTSSSRFSIIPMVFEQTGRGERMCDIYSRLLKERIVCMMGTVSYFLAIVVGMLQGFHGCNQDSWKGGFTTKVAYWLGLNFEDGWLIVTKMWRVQHCTMLKITLGTSHLTIHVYYISTYALLRSWPRARIWGSSDATWILTVVHDHAERGFVRTPPGYTLVNSKEETPLWKSGPLVLVITLYLVTSVAANKWKSN